MREDSKKEKKYKLNDEKRNGRERKGIKKWRGEKRRN